MPLLWHPLRLKGTVVCMDAAHCQSDTKDLIVERGGEWLVSLAHDDRGDHAAAGCSKARPSPTSKCRGRWKGLRGVILCERKMIVPVTHTETTGRRIFMTSLPPQAVEPAVLVRQVESSLPWSLDVLWRTDEARARTGYAATNHTLIGKTAVNLLKLLQPQFSKMSVARIMKRPSARPSPQTAH